MQSPPVGNLKDRIAALQQRSVSAPIQNQPSASAASKSSPGSNGGPSVGSLRSKIAKFEAKGAVPAPRGSFGLGAPPEQVHNISRELYGNRIGSLNKPSGPVSRSGSPLPSLEDSPGLASVSTIRRLSTGTFDIPPVDLTGVTQKLFYQQSMNGADSGESTPAAESSADDDGIIDGSRQNSPTVDGSADSPSASAPPSPIGNTLVLSDESVEELLATPSIVISPDRSSPSLPLVTEGLPPTEEVTSVHIDEPNSNVLLAAEPVTVYRASPEAESVTAVVEDCVMATPLPVEAKSPSPIAESAPLASPITPSITGGGNNLLEHPPDSPYLEFTRSEPPAPTSPQSKRTVATPSAPKPEIVVERPARSSSLAANLRPSTRSPSPTPSMIHQPEGGAAENIASTTTARKPRSTNKANRRTIVGLPANPPPVSDSEDVDMTYGSVTLGSRSETNLLDAATKNKPMFSAVVHRKITEMPLASAPELPSAQSMPITPFVRRTLVLSASTAPPPSPGYADLAALLEEAAMLEERLARGETANDIVDKIRGPEADTFQLQPFSVGSASVPSIRRSATPESYESESHDQMPTTSPSKGGLPRMLSGLKKLASSGAMRSIGGSHSRLSTSGSEFSSEDSASVNTPSENGLAFPSMHSNGSFDRQSMSSALGVGSSPSSKKSASSMSRASSIAEKIWHRGRTKSNNSNNGAC